MQSVNTGLLGKLTFDESTIDRSKTSCQGSKAYNLESNFSSEETFKSRNEATVRMDEDTIELQDLDQWSGTIASAVAGSDIQSVTSDGSERAIIVTQTISVSVR